jgi:hypothetical protein
MRQTCMGAHCGECDDCYDMHQRRAHEADQERYDAEMQRLYNKEMDASPAQDRWMLEIRGRYDTSPCYLWRPSDRPEIQRVLA